MDSPDGSVEVACATGEGSAVLASGVICGEQEESRTIKMRVKSKPKRFFVFIA